MIGMMVGLLGGQADPASQRSGTEEAPAGPRMNGKYAGGGLQLEFHPTAVVIDCGEAHVLKPYTVQNLTDRLVVTVPNGTLPVSLTLRSDGALVGSGSIEVAGRVVTGANDNGATFAPRTERCTVGSLNLQ